MLGFGFGSFHRHGESKRLRKQLGALGGLR